MLLFFQKQGQRVFDSFARLGRANFFLWYSLMGMGTLIKRPFLLVQQIHFVGVRSLSIILVSGLFVGMVLGLQGYTILVNFGATESLGIMVSLTLVRELGPVLAAILFAGRAGSALAAEIGLMKSTEQLSAVELMAVNPLHRIIAPRLLAGMIALPLLTLIFNAVGFLGGHLVVVTMLGVDVGSYWGTASSVDFYNDVMNGVIKSIVFGFVVT